MKANDKCQLKGIFRMKVFKDGKLIEDVMQENLIVNIAKEQMAHLVAGDNYQRFVTSIAFGTSGTQPAATDTVLAGQWPKQIESFEFPDANLVKFNWVLNTSENNGMAIREYGLLTGDGRLFARVIRQNVIYKESDISLEGSWTIKFMHEGEEEE